MLRPEMLHRVNKKATSQAGRALCIHKITQVCSKEMRHPNMTCHHVAPACSSRTHTYAHPSPRAGLPGCTPAHTHPQWRAKGRALFVTGLMCVLMPAGPTMGTRTMCVLGTRPPSAPKPDTPVCTHPQGKGLLVEVNTAWGGMTLHCVSWKHGGCAPGWADHATRAMCMVDRLSRLGRPSHMRPGTRPNPTLTLA